MAKMGLITRGDRQEHFYLIRNPNLFKKLWTNEKKILVKKISSPPHSPFLPQAPKVMQNRKFLGLWAFLTKKDSEWSLVMFYKVRENLITRILSYRVLKSANPFKSYSPRKEFKSIFVHFCFCSKLTPDGVGDKNKSNLF